MLNDHHDMAITEKKLLSFSNSKYIYITLDIFIVKHSYKSSFYHFQNTKGDLASHNFPFQVIGPHYLGGVGPTTLGYKQHKIPKMVQKVGESKTTFSSHF
ncbi:hypothetical protein LguiA_009153 [Lonicera macranthoides]